MEKILEEMSVEEICDLGVALIKSSVSEKDDDKKNRGIDYLLLAYKEGDLEAAAWVGLLMYRGVLNTHSGSTTEEALNILNYAAYKGNMTARVFLNKLCSERYKDLISDRIQKKSPFTGPLVDFDGRKITIKKTGIRVPVDAVLNYDNGINVLTFSLNLLFADEDVPDQNSFENAVISGIKEWEGEYQVFGGQSLRVVIDITADERLFDNVLVLAVTEEYASLLKNMPGLLKTDRSEKRIDDLINKNRSMAVTGMRKWSTKSRKMILIASEDNKFNDYNEIKNVAKHEFGHALGLGDLYTSASDGLAGVEKGTYSELDGYYISNKNYNLVMSDHHGPISNNDIEMVVLAFCDDEIQLYQEDPRHKGKISKALGKGN